MQLHASIGFATVLFVSSLETDASEEVLTGLVVNVLSGDTIQVRPSDGEDLEVALYGIIAPRLGDEFGPTSRDTLELTVMHRNVSMEVTGTEKNGRLVAWVWIEDISLNVELVRGGLAWWDKRSALHDETLKVAEREAKRNYRGIWCDYFKSRLPWDDRRPSSR